MKTAISLDSSYWKQQMALIPEPQKMDRYPANLSDFYSHLTVSKELFNMIKCPVLVIAGERDLNAPLPTVANAYNMIPNSQPGVIHNAGHGFF